MVERSIKKTVEDFHTILSNYGIDVDKIVLYGSYAKGKIMMIMISIPERENQVNHVYTV